MSNSKRWRRLCEWARYLSESGVTLISLRELIDKVEEIKREERKANEC